MKEKNRETQQILGNGAATKAFYVMFTVAVISVIVQLIFLNAGFQSVIDELGVILCGGVIYLLGSIKKGFQMSANSELTIFEDILVSIVCSCIFSILYGIYMVQEIGNLRDAGRNIGVFFVSVFVVCFLGLWILNKYTCYLQNRRERESQE